MGMAEGHSEGQEAGRVTAPQQAYGFGHVVKGLVVLVVGLAITMGLPLLLA